MFFPIDPSEALERVLQCSSVDKVAVAHVSMQPKLVLKDEPHSPNSTTGPNARRSIRWKDRRMNNGISYNVHQLRCYLVVK